MAKIETAFEKELIGVNGGEISAAPGEGILVSDDPKEMIDEKVYSQYRSGFLKDTQWSISSQIMRARIRSDRGY